MYSTGKRHGADKRLREMVEPILTGHTTETPESKPSSSAGAKPLFQADSILQNSRSRPLVQVVLGGHDHIYQRFHPQQGVAYFVCGSSGKLRRGNAKPDPSVAVAEDRQNVFMLWEVFETELRFRAINSSGEAFDCGMVGPDGVVTSADCGSWPGLTSP